MKRLLITEEDKRDILILYGINENTDPPKIIKGVGADKYDYKEENGEYFTKLKDQQIWTSLKNTEWEAEVKKLFDSDKGKSQGNLQYNWGGGGITTNNVGSSESSSINYTTPSTGFSKQLNEAKQWWIDWLSSPITKQKFSKLWNYSNEKTNDIFETYLYFIEEANYKLSDGSDMLKNSIMQVTKREMNVIKINKNMIIGYDVTQIKRMFIHEIQHLLHYYHPLNPMEKSSALTGDDGCFDENQRIFGLTKVDVIPTLDNIEKTKKLIAGKEERISKDLNVNSNELPNLLSYLVYRTYKQPKEYFLKNSSEFGSRLSSTRDFFGVKPDGKITKNQIINYIKSNKNDIEVDFVLGRWVAMDFPPIEDFLNDINSFAMSDFNKSNKDSFG
jgi:hypothetical protein